MTFGVCVCVCVCVYVCVCQGSKLTVAVVANATEFQLFATDLKRQ